MSGPTKIEWADLTWSPVTGCTKVSEGCRNCYAERMAKRLVGRAGYPKEDPFAVTLHPERLDEPLHWRKPRRIFVCSMSDLFHPDVPFSFLAKVWDTMFDALMAGCDEEGKHKFLVLTKRPERLLEFAHWMSDHESRRIDYPGVWLGTSIEDQTTADERIPHLLQCPAAVRFVSYEPALGPVSFRWLSGVDYSRQAISNEYDGLRKLDWIIAGGESGPKARPAHPDWFRSVRDQCQAAGVPFFFKQWGEWSPVGEDVPFTGHEEALSRDGERSTVGVHLAAAVTGLDGWSLVNRVGKKAAGRLLDGREWNEYPACQG